MKLSIKDKWVRALKSGRYTQARTSLRITREDGTQSHCCLGVLCDLMQIELGAQSPSSWDVHGDAFGENEGMPPYSVYVWAGLSDSDADYLASENDGGKSFEEIAQLILENPDERSSLESGVLVDDNATVLVHTLAG